MKKIIFLGTKGIPNTHGGYERFVEKLSPYLAQKGFDVTVVCPHFQEYRDNEFGKVRLKFIYDPERSIGAIGNLVYDLFAIIYGCLGKYDVIYMCAYTSAIFLWIPRVLSPRSKLVTNMDGLEWKRSKYSKWKQKYLELCERLAVVFSTYLIADGNGIFEYLSDKFSKQSNKIETIAYGTEYPVKDFRKDKLQEYNVVPEEYSLLVARIEPENNIKEIIDAYVSVSKFDNIPLLVVGPTNTSYGEMLLNKYKNSSVRFLDGVYDEKMLFTLRKYAFINFHGHSVGGTNPSLLEALSVGKRIICHDNVFNRSTMNNLGFYFTNSDDLTDILQKYDWKQLNFETQFKKLVEQHYTWKIINEKYLNYLNNLFQ